MATYLVARANKMFVAVLIASAIAFGWLTWDRIASARQAREWSQHSYDVLAAVKDLNLAIRDAETGQRGYLLTGRDEYLTPYNQAVEKVSFLEGELQRLTADNSKQQTRLRNLSPIVQHKLEELGQTVELRRTDGFGAALRVVNTDVGRNYMVQIESALDAMTTDEQGLLAQRLYEADSRAKLVRWSIGGAYAFALLALIYAALLLNKAWSQSTRMETEQRTLALRLRTSLDSLSQGVAVFNAERNISHWNECFQVLLSLPKAMLRIGMPYAAFAEQSSSGGVPLLETEDQIRHGRSIAGQPTTYESIAPDNTHLELRRTSMPDGGFVLTVTDMTKRAQAEAVLREAQKMQAIGQLTGGIAHDFNNLLTIILGNLEFARSKTSSDSAIQTYLERATWASQRGATLTGQLLAFARKQPLTPAPINLGAEMPTLIPLLRRTLGEHIDVRYVETAGLWPAMADPAQLESAVLNLALNARDAMPGGGRLTIELANKVLDADYASQHAEVEAGDYAMLAVSDTGCGMSPDVAARVFEPFYTTKADGKGTGLGLAMVFGFVKQSGGHVKIYSEPGEGTTVRIYLPRAIGGLSSKDQRGTVPLELPRGTATILVVEDEPAVREITVAILRDLGYRVFEAGDGEEGLRVFGTNVSEINLLVTDVVLPGTIRGRELSERIAAVKPSMKILFMSGYTENSIVHNGRLDDGVHLLSKPFKREQLAKKVAEVLGALDASSDDSNVIELSPRSRS